MKKTRSAFESLRILILSGMGCWISTAAMAAEWPQYRGPNRDGRSTETGLIRSWPSAGPEVIWRTPLGSGYSGIAIADHRVFTLFGSEGSEYAVALAAEDGREIWKVRLGENRPDSQGEGPRTTPTVEGDTVYVLGARARLAALDVESGEVRWDLDLRSELGAKVPQWGVASSPLVEGDRLIVEVGGRENYTFVAFDKGTGEVVWNSGTSQPGYASPIAATLQGRRQIVFFPAQGLIGVAAEDGQLLWSVPWKTTYDVNAATPIFVRRDSFFISSGYDTGAALVTVSKGESGLTADFSWKSRVMKNHFNSSVLVGDLIYGFDNATFKCIEARSGDEVWRARGGYAKGASLLYADEMLIVLGGEGRLGLVRATPEGYEELATAEVSRGRTWTMPSLAGGALYIRDFKQISALKVIP